MRAFLIVPLCLAAACSGGEEANRQKAAEAPERLPAGTWQTRFEVTAIRSTDKTTPAIKAAVGDQETASNCVTEAERPKPAPELFAGPGYSCRYNNDYIKSGMINATLTCTGKGLDGEVGMVVQGSYTADGFEATVDANSFLPGRGDFALSRKLSGKLTPGACLPAAAAAAGKGGEGKGKAGG